MKTGINSCGFVREVIVRDRADSRFERLEPWEQRWALLVIKICRPCDGPPVMAVADARRRGLSWAAIGRALGVSAPVGPYTVR